MKYDTSHRIELALSQTLLFMSNAAFVHFFHCTAHQILRYSRRGYGILHQVIKCNHLNYFSHKDMVFGSSTIWSKQKHACSKLLAKKNTCIHIALHPYSIEGPGNKNYQRH